MKRKKKKRARLAETKIRKRTKRPVPDIDQEVAGQRLLESYPDFAGRNLIIRPQGWSEPR